VIGHEKFTAESAGEGILMII